VVCQDAPGRQSAAKLLSKDEARWQEMQLINVVIVLTTLISSAHAGEQKATVQTDTVPIENPPLPRPRPLLLDVTGDNPAVLISAFRHQHGEGSVAISAALTGIAQEQANAMALATRSITMYWPRLQTGSIVAALVAQPRISRLVMRTSLAP
jgi:hypothetical protein